MGNENVSKSIADGVVQLTILRIYMRRISSDSATVNFFFFTEDE